MSCGTLIMAGHLLRGEWRALNVHPSQPISRQSTPSIRFISIWLRLASGITLSSQIKTYRLKNLSSIFL